MSIKNDPMYKYYICWLESQVLSGTISQGHYELIKISESYFLDFCFDFNNRNKFKLLVEGLYKSINRESIINDIIDESTL